MSEIYEGEYALKAVDFSADKFCTYFGLKLPYLIFSATEQLSITLQSVKTAIQEAVTSLKLEINFLDRQSSFELFYRRF